jgi:hypothetical protein
VLVGRDLARLYVGIMVLLLLCMYVCMYDVYMYVRCVYVCMYDACMYDECRALVTVVQTLAQREDSAVAVWLVPGLAD